MRVSRLTVKRMTTVTSQLNPIGEPDDDIDLNFVVEGDFFDGEEFQPMICTGE